MDPLLQADNSRRALRRLGGLTGSTFALSTLKRTRFSVGGLRAQWLSRSSGCAAAQLFLRWSPGSHEAPSESVATEALTELQFRQTTPIIKRHSACLSQP